MEDTEGTRQQEEGTQSGKDDRDALIALPMAARHAEMTTRQLRDLVSNKTCALRVFKINRHLYLNRQEFLAWWQRRQATHVS